MIVLSVLAGIILLMLLMPIKVRFMFKNGEFTARMGYLFFWRRLAAESEDERPGKKRRFVNKRKKARTAPPKKRRLDTSPKELISMLVSTREPLERIRRHIVVSRVKVYISAGGEDAHRAAIAYGQICCAAHALLEVIGAMFSLKKTVVAIAPNFRSEQTKYEISARISVRPVFALAFAIRIFRSVITTARSAPKDKEQLDRTRKAG